MKKKEKINFSFAIMISKFMFFKSLVNVALICMKNQFSTKNKIIESGFKEKISD